MNKKKPFNNILLLALVIVIAALGYWYYDKQKPGDLDQFAQCLGDKGAKFYGAFWCPHCQAQKALFGKSKDKLPYVECSTSDSKGQTKECADKGIQSYPTWSFPIVSTTSTSTEEFISGEQTLQALSEKTGCVVPAVK